MLYTHSYTYIRVYSALSCFDEFLKTVIQKFNEVRIFYENLVALNFLNLSEIVRTLSTYIRVKVP